MNRALAWIHSTGYVGPGGLGIEALDTLLRSGKSALKRDDQFPGSAWSGRYDGDIQFKVHRHTDRSVLLGLAAVQQVIEGLSPSELSDTGIAMGTSRGPSGLWERYHAGFEKNEPLSPLTSPLTTPGILASAIAQQFRLGGNALTLSMTCSSSMVAILNGIAWLRGGLCSHYIAGGAEAPLTPFTFAQSDALHLLSRLQDVDFPCLALALDKVANTMVLSEASACLRMQTSEPQGGGVAITGFGSAIEAIPSASGISPEGDAFYQAMEKALAMSPGNIDVICVHAPGTVFGDRAEVQAIQRLFQKGDMPVLYPVKAFTGHTFGASGIIGVLAAMACLESPLPLPDYLMPSSDTPQARRVMVNAAGFGGQAVSLILEKS